MALKINIETPHGLTIPGSYHRIVQMYFNAPDRLHVQLEVHVTEADRHANKQPIEQRSIYLTASDVVTAGTLLGSVYNKIKATPEYAGSEDV